MYRRRKDDNSGLGCVFIIMLILFVLPVYGLYKTLSPNSTEDEKTGGVVMIIVGIIIWVLIWVFGKE